MIARLLFVLLQVVREVATEVGGSVLVLDPASGATLWAWPAPGCRALAWSPGGGALAVGAEAGLQLLEARRARAVATGVVDVVAWSPCGGRVATGAGERLADKGARGLRVVDAAGAVEHSADDSVYWVAWSCDGWLAVCRGDGVLAVRCGALKGRLGKQDPNM